MGIGHRTIQAVLASTIATLAFVSLAAAQERAGVVTTLEGKVTVVRASAAEPSPLKFRDAVFVRDRIATDKDSFARVLLGGRAVVTIREYSTVTITEVPGVATVDVASGRVAVAVARERMRPGDLIEVRTPNAVAGIRGTVIVAEVFDSRHSVITVLKGVIDVTRLDAGRLVGPSTILNALQQVTIGGAVSSPQPVSSDTARSMRDEFRTVPPRGAPVATTAAVSQGEMERMSKDLGVDKGKSGQSVDSVQANAPPPPPPPPPPGGNPNEPAGFQRFAENDFTVPMLDHTAPTGLLGLWRAEILDSDNTYVADAAAPKSPLPVFQGKYPAGWTAGYTPIKWEGWDGAANSLGYGTEMAQMYLSLWIRFPGADYENQSVGTKFFYLGVGESKASAGNQLYTMLYHPSGAGQTIASNFPVSMEQQSAVAGVNNRTEITAAPVFSIGAWHRMEFVLQLNTIGQANGVFRWWVDGTLVMDYRDMIYVDAANPLGFFTFKFWPYWGGGGGSKTRDDYVQVDHVYLSGVPK